MAASPHETLIRDYIEAVFNRHELDDLASYWREDLSSHWMGQQTLHGLPAWRRPCADFFTAFPDLTHTLDDLFLADNRGVWRGHWRGTQHGDWAGIASTGKTAEWTAIIIGRFADGKLAKDWWSTTGSGSTGNSASSRSAGDRCSETRRRTELDPLPTTAAGAQSKPRLSDEAVVGAADDA